MAANLGIVAAQAQTAAAAERTGIARKRQWLPELAAGVAVVNHGSGVEAGPAIRIGLPWLGGAGAMADRSAAELRRAEHQLTALAIDLRAAARAARQTALATFAEAKQLRDVVVPLRRRIVDETLLHYNAMNADPFTLIMAQRELTDGNRQLLAAQLRFAQALVRVAALRHGLLRHELLHGARQHQRWPSQCHVHHRGASLIYDSTKTSFASQFTFQWLSRRCGSGWRANLTQRRSTYTCRDRTDDNCACHGASATIANRRLPNGAVMPYTTRAGVKVFHLVAEPINHELTTGLHIKAWGYNGRTPGPVIEVTQGDRCRFYVTNKLPEPTSLHWHGIILPNGMDGVARSRPEIHRPRSDLQIRIHVPPRWHVHVYPHSDEMTQIALGMTGMIVVHPRRPVTSPGNAGRRIRDYALMLHEWKIPIGTDRPDPLAMNDFNVLTFNSKAYPATMPLIAQVGDLVRMRFGNFRTDGSSPNSHARPCVCNRRKPTVAPCHYRHACPRPPC